MKPETRSPGGNRANAQQSAWTAHAQNTTFIKAVQAAGYNPPREPRPGEELRFPAPGKKPGNDAAVCKLDPNGRSGFYGDHISDTWHQWRADNGDPRAEVEEAERQAAEVEKRQRAQANAERIWRNAKPANRDHPYLVAKNVQPFGIRQDGDALIVPVRTVRGELRAIQRILLKSKPFNKGAETAGNLYLIGEPDQRIIVAEGYSTAASLHEATGDAVAVAFSCGNLTPAAKALRDQYPETQIIVAADDDRNKPRNAGIEDGTKAARAVSGLLATPGRAGDFNDLHRDAGANAVCKRIKQAAPVTPKGFRLVRAGTLKAKNHDWLIDGLLERDSLAAFFGPPETWKSLYMIDACCSVAHGVDFHGAKVKQGNAVYVCGEGFAGLSRRFRAWCIRHDINPDENRVMVSTQAAALNDPETFATVADRIAEAKPDLVVIDTLARNFGPGDENATSDMTGFIAACDRIRAENGCAVALVHHSGLMDKTRGRGNSALKGALDWEYMFKRTGEVVEVECSKVKDADRPPPQAFTLDIVIVDEAKDIRSVTLAKSEPPQPAPTTKKGKHQVKALAVLESMVDQHGENLAESGRSKDNAKVRLLDWRDECQKEGIPRNRWYEVKRTLQAANEIEVTSGFVYLSGCPVS